jgi:Domain of unknown function (DUF4384)/Papain family cysteine protease
MLLRTQCPSARYTAFIVLMLFSLSTNTVAQNQYPRGLVWEDDRYNLLPVRYGTTVSLPPSKSLKAYYPKVVNQPRADYTGVAWSAVWNARTAAEAIACSQRDPQRVLQLAFAPAYNYGLIRTTPDCQTAISVIDLLESLEKNGTPYFSEFRDFCPSEIPTDLYALAKVKRLSGYTKLYNTKDLQNVKVQSVKNALVASNAVLAGMVCPPSFQLAQEFWQPRESQPDPTYGGHAVCIVGYDDTKFGGAFEVVNTWGKDWAIQGYTWVRYKDFAEYFPYAFGLFQVTGAACDVAFDANVTFKLLSGEQMRVNPDVVDGVYKFNKTYPSGTSFTIQMNSNVPAYIYSFGVDPENTYFPLFPRATATSPISFTTLRAPDDMAAVTLTDPPGKNSIFFIFSPNQIDLTSTIAQLKNQKDLTPVKVQAALATSGVPLVKWNQTNLSFTGTLPGPVVMKVVLEQTKK